MTKQKNTTPTQRTPILRRMTPTVSAHLQDGRYVELIYDQIKNETAFALWDGNTWHRVEEIEEGKGRFLVPYGANNNLIRNRVVLLPSEPEEYGTEEELVKDVRQYLHKYVDLSARFEQLAAYYVLFSWIYDGFNELPYIRIRGSYGSGKTRFLLIAGSICYKPIFASGASTVAPIFHTLNAFQGTLIIDEADFRFSDEKASVTKILNNGNVKGLHVLRVETTAQKEFNPKAFYVYGPKLVATRGFYEDRALESRFITEETGGRLLRKDIPINLPTTYTDEALRLRNKLLLYRFRTAGTKPILDELVDHRVEPRLNQIFVPLLSTVVDTSLRREISELRTQFQDDLTAERGMDIEAQVLQVMRKLATQKETVRLSIGAITKDFIAQFGESYERHITTKWIGTIIRRKLHLKAHKSHGIFVIPPNELRKLAHLYDRYGIAEDGAPEEEPANDTVAYVPVDKGDNGDVGGGVIKF